MSDDHFGTREEMIDRYRAEQKAHNACYERAHMLEREVAALREACQAARKVLDETRQTFGINLPATFEVIEKIDRALKSQFAQGTSK